MHPNQRARQSIVRVVPVQYRVNNHTLFCVTRVPVVGDFAGLTQVPHDGMATCPAIAHADVSGRHNW